MNPSDSGSTMSRQPMPLGEEITGMRSLRANSVSSLPASDSATPWPMNSTGRLAARIVSRAALTCSGEAPLRWVPCRGRSRRHLDVVLLLEHVEGYIHIDRP